MFKFSFQLIFYQALVYLSSAKEVEVTDWYLNFYVKMF